MSSYIPHFKPFTKLSGRRGSNPRPSAWEADALPLSYSRISEYKYTPLFFIFQVFRVSNSHQSTIFFSDARFFGFFRSRPSGV